MKKSFYKIVWLINNLLFAHQSMAFNIPNPFESISKFDIYSSYARPKNSSQVNNEAKSLTYSGDISKCQKMIPIIVDKYPNLEHVSINCFLSDETISQLSKLRSLKHLSVKLNQEHMLNGIQTLTSLESLQIKSSKLTKLPENIKLLSNLKFLGLNKVKNLVLLPDYLGQMEMLTSLNLSQSKNIAFKKSQRFPNITQLDLSSTNTKTFGFLSPCFNNLVMLDISCNANQGVGYADIDIGEKDFAGLKELRFLNAQENKLSTRDLAHIHECCPNITHLNITFNKGPQYFDPDILGCFTELKYLDASYCGILDIEFLRKLKFLEHLDLSTNNNGEYGNKQESLSLDNLPKMPLLKSIDLSCLDIGDLNPLWGKKLPQLTTLNFHGNNTVPSLEQAQKVFPNLKSIVTKCD